jgi:hypothetical protein
MIDAAYNNLQPAFLLSWRFFVRLTKTLGLSVSGRGQRPLATTFAKRSRVTELLPEKGFPSPPSPRKY